MVFTLKIKTYLEISFSKTMESMGAFLDILLGIRTVKLLSIESLKFWEWKKKYRVSLNIGLINLNYEKTSEKIA